MSLPPHLPPTLFLLCPASKIINCLDAHLHLRFPFLTSNFSLLPTISFILSADSPDPASVHDRPLSSIVSARKRSISGICIKTLSLKLAARKKRALFCLYHLLFAVLTVGTCQVSHNFYFYPYCPGFLLSARLHFQAPGGTKFFILSSLGPALENCLCWQTQWSSFFLFTLNSSLSRTTYLLSFASTPTTRFF